jgi:hypothetical protein
MCKNPIRLALAAVTLGLISAPISAQGVKQFVVPKANATTPGNNPFNDVPFGRGTIRYQQIFRASDIKQSVAPVRIRGVTFRGSASGTNQAGQSLDLEVVMAHHTGIVFPTFAQNLSKDLQIVYKRQTSANNWFKLATNTPTFHIQIPFDAGVEFVWDGVSDIVLDIRIHGNSNNNGNFVYWMDSATNASAFQRLFANKPNDKIATTNQNFNGLVARFDYLEGVTVSYGDGCKGLGGIIPHAKTNILPLVGSPNLNIEVELAPPSQPAIVLWGGSRTTWGAIPLPLDLRPAGIPGCSLLVDPIFVWGTATNGGSPGTGRASLPFTIPPVGALRGIQLFFQWAIFDQSQGRAIPLTFSDGMVMVIG